MRTHHHPAVALAAAALALSAPAALAKENVHARLDSVLPMNARPGTSIRVSWTLTRTVKGRHRPFDAGGLFVRLVSASHHRSTTGYARGGRGHYVARVVVPRGGIGGIKLGLAGIRYVGGRMEDAPIYFPIDNNPFRRG